MIKKGLAVAVILLFMGMSVVPSTAVQELKDVSTVSFDGNTLYVGGSGQNNYTTIQSAIDDAVDGDTVFVYSNIYHEIIHVDKSIRLIGEDRDSTIIEGDGDVGSQKGIVDLDNDDISLIGFTINNSDKHGISSTNESKNITISNCRIENIAESLQNCCIFVWMYTKSWIIQNCIISPNNNAKGIRIFNGENMLIYNNTIQNCMVGISASIRFSVISHNKITNCNSGIIVHNLVSTSIEYNNITDNEKGFVHDKKLFESSSEITRNNFINNDRHFEISGAPFGWTVSYSGNYWDNWKGFGMKMILGSSIVEDNYGNIIIFLPLIVRFDRSPLSNPVDIEV